MPTRVILRKQRREVNGVEYKPGEACVLPDELAEGLACYGLCDIALPPDGAKKPKVDEAATKAAAEKGQKTRAKRFAEPKKKKKKEDPPK
jgi:hypothetical protein